MSTIATSDPMLDLVRQMRHMNAVPASTQPPQPDFVEQGDADSSTIAAPTDPMVELVRQIRRSQPIVNAAQSFQPGATPSPSMGPTDPLAALHRRALAGVPSPVSPLGVGVQTPPPSDAPPFAGVNDTPGAYLPMLSDPPERGIGEEFAQAFSQAAPAGLPDLIRPAFPETAAGMEQRQAIQVGRPGTGVAASVGQTVGGMLGGLINPQEAPANVVGYLTGAKAVKMAQPVLAKIAGLAGPKVASVVQHAIGGAGGMAPLGALHRAAQIPAEQWASDPIGSVGEVLKAAGIAGTTGAGIGVATGLVSRVDPRMESYGRQIGGARRVNPQLIPNESPNAGIESPIGAPEITVQQPEQVRNSAQSQGLSVRTDSTNPEAASELSTDVPHGTNPGIKIDAIPVGPAERLALPEGTTSKDSLQVGVVEPNVKNAQGSTLHLREEQPNVAAESEKSFVQAERSEPVQEPPREELATEVEESATPDVAESRGHTLTDSSPQPPKPGDSPIYEGQGGEANPIDGAPKKARARQPFSRSDLEQRIRDAYDASPEREARTQQLAIDAEKGGFDDGSAMFSFPDKLPPEVRDATEGNPLLRSVFSTGKRSGKGADYLAELGVDRYLKAAEESRRPGIDSAVDALRKSHDPEHQFLAAVHDNMPDGRQSPKVALKPDELAIGTKFTLNGERMRVVEGDHGIAVLKDGEKYPETPVDSMKQIPADRGSVVTGRAGSPEPKLSDKLESKASEVLQRIQRRKIPRGGGTGATSLPDDIYDGALWVAYKAGQYGAKAVERVADFTKQLVTDHAPHLAGGLREAKIERMARAILKESKSKEGLYTPEDFERALTNPKGNNTTEGMALREGASRAYKAAKEAYKEGRAEELANAQEQMGYLSSEAKKSRAEAVKRERQVGSFERRSAKIEGAAKEWAKADTADAIRAKLVETIQKHVPDEYQGNFLDAAAKTKTREQVARVISRIGHAIANSRLNQAIREARAASAAADPTKMIDSLRQDTQAARVELRAATAGRASAKTVEEKAALADRIEAVRDTLKELKHQQTAFNTLRIAGKLVEREKLVAKAVPNIKAARNKIDMGGERERTPEAGAIAKFHQAHLNPDAVGAVLKDPDLRRLLADESWRAETKVQGTTQAGQDALFAAMKRAGFEPGSKRRLELSEAAAGKDKARNVPLKLSGGAVNATPAEWMALAATLDDVHAGRRIEAGAPIVWERAKNGTKFNLSPEDIDRVKAYAEKEAPGVIAAMKAFIEKSVTPDVNAAFREQKGYDLKLQERYWRTRRLVPKTRAADVLRSVNFAVNRALENLGFLKEREPITSAPYVIGDVFRDFHEIVHQGAVVSHMTRAVRNAESVFFDSRVSKAIESRFGRGMNGHIERHIQSMKMLFDEPGVAIDRPLDRMMRNYARSVLSLSPSSMMKNLGGAFKLAGEFEAADLAAGLKAAGKAETYTEMDKNPFFRNRQEHAPWARLSPMPDKPSPLLGEARAADLVKGANVGELVDRIRLYDKTDKFVAAVAWGAAKSEAMRTGAGIAGVGERAEFAVRRTQNGMSDLERSAVALQAKRSALRPLLMFTSDSNKSYNQIVSGYAESRAKGNRALAAVALNNAWAAGVGTLFATMLARKSKPNDKKAPGITDRLVQQALRATLGQVYGGDIAVDAIYGLYRKANTGQKPQSVFQSPVLQTAETAYDAVTDMVGAAQAKGLMEGGEERGKPRQRVMFLRALEQGALAASKLTGLPIEPLWRIWKKIAE